MVNKKEPCSSIKIKMQNIKDQTLNINNQLKSYDDMLENWGNRFEEKVVATIEEYTEMIDNDEQEQDNDHLNATTIGEDETS